MEILPAKYSTASQITFKTILLYFVFEVKMAKILIIDDNADICDILSRTIESQNHCADVTHTLTDGLNKVHKVDYDVVFLDVQLPDGNGLSALGKIRGTSLSPEVIIITGFGDPEGAELAIKYGAWDYIVKPFSDKEMLLQLMRALEYRKEKLSKKLPMALKHESIIGNSLKMKTCFDLVAQATTSNANVLINGETGTGKELFARAIHENSSRKDNKFVVVDCTTLPESLVESILLGHEKGAFTGADKTRTGLIKIADEGTLFLDEVGELPVTLQKVFLRVLQEHRFLPVGSSREVTSDFRLIAATNRDLDIMVKRGEFREDLLFRLRTITIPLPPLRERDEDIEAIAQFYMAKFCEQYGIDIKGFSPDFFYALTSYDWPGNVRELVNTVERAFTAARYEPILFPIHLPTDIRIKITRKSTSQAALAQRNAQESNTPPETLPKLQEFREAAINKSEKEYLENLMSITEGNIKKSCQISGIQRARLYELFKKYNISGIH